MNKTPINQAATPRQPGRSFGLIAIILCTIAANSSAQTEQPWRLIEPNPNSQIPPWAQADSETGERVAITTAESQDATTIVGRFQLAVDSLITLSGESCPTFQVDDEPPRLVGRGRCALVGSELRFDIADVRDKAVQSRTLDQLVRGSELKIRYRLERFGYREATFSLRRSKQSIGKILGEGVRIRTE